MNSTLIPHSIQADLEMQKKRVYGHMQIFLKTQRRRVLDYSPESVHLYDTLIRFCRGGKYVRPLTLIYGYQLFHAGSEAQIIPLAAAVELLQNFLLIHDDIMDRSKLRRGELAIHEYYKEYIAKNYKNPKHVASHGEASAMLVGDLAYTLAIELVLQSDLAPEVKTPVLKCMMETVEAIIWGQERDIFLEHRSTVSSQQIVDVYRLKTANYSFVMPLTLGALVARATPAQLTVLSNFGVNAGLAFQIKDDILDLFGDPKLSGKAVGTDIRQGKKTLLVSYALNNCASTTKTRLLTLLGKEECSRHEIHKVQQLIRKCGALAWGEEQIERYITQAQKHLYGLKKCTVNHAVLTKLHMLVTFIKQRTS